MLLEFLMSSVYLEPLFFWFCLLDSQSPKAIVGKTLLLSSLQLAGIICELFLFLVFYSWSWCLNFLSEAPCPYDTELARDVVYGFNDDIHIFGFFVSPREMLEDNISLYVT